jgi:hypothetical protein
VGSDRTPSVRKGNTINSSYASYWSRSPQQRVHPTEALMLQRDIGARQLHISAHHRQRGVVHEQPTSQLGADHDTAMINTTMQLSSPSAEEVVFVLPSAEESEQAPVMRMIADSPLEPHEFESTSFDDVEAELQQASGRHARPT